MSKEERIKIDSRFGKLTNSLKIKRFEDGNIFVTIRNGYDKETGKTRGGCILLKPEQIEVLKKWL